jgi:hypothetical protein
LIQRIGKNGEVQLSQQQLTDAGLRVGDSVDFYVKDGVITVVKSGAKPKGDGWVLSSEGANNANN